MSENATRVLGRLLLIAGAIGAAELAEALEEQRRTRQRLAQVLVRRGTDPEVVARALATQLRLPFAEARLAPEPASLELVDRELAARLRVVPLSHDERTLRVAMADPLDSAAVDDLQFRTGRRVEPVVATAALVDHTLSTVYDRGAVERLLTRLPTARPAPASPERAPSDEVGALRRASEAAPIVALGDLILERAPSVGASDVHVEPEEGRLRVRARVDGLLQSITDLPDHAAAAVVSRLKIMAGLDIAVKLRPQDGRAAVKVGRRDIGLRVSTLPGQRGEKVVLRLLEPENAARRLMDLGFSPDAQAQLERLLRRGHGAILVTGPTGSGKTTTLYAALAALDRERRNIVTLEDPVEYRLPGLTQVQVRPRAGLTFPAALRAVLRQDPDVIMVGELRDRETVEVGMAAALTGHLVLSTVHTNDSPGAVARLLEMGAPPYLVAGGAIAVVAQLIVRRLCARCRTQRGLETHELHDLGGPARSAQVYEPNGCQDCDGTGYTGRIGIFELLLIDAAIRQLILDGAPVDSIRNTARASGMEPLGQDAWRKVLAGLTSLEEVRPLLSLLADEAPVCPACGANIRRTFCACTQCGHTLRPRCACGEPLDPTWLWCPECGTRQA
jgi:type IV pilus assembly protein PilB